MSKRSKKTVTLGSGKAYLAEVSAEQEWDYDTIKALATEDNLIGLIKGGFALEYSVETYTESDDLNLVTKVITTKEEAVAKLGLLTWNGETLSKILSHAEVVTGEEADESVRRTKIGGAGNGADKDYVLVFHHEDKVDGDVWAAIKGHNTAGATLTFGVDAGTVVEPEFKALPHDDDGTLIELYEELADTTE